MKRRATQLSRRAAVAAGRHPRSTPRRAGGDQEPSRLDYEEYRIGSPSCRTIMVDVINQYACFPLPRHWSSGRTAIADGTHVKLRENNLMGSRHIRYGGYGRSYE
jgi:hypothetical protein